MMIGNKMLYCAQAIHSNKKHSCVNFRSDDVYVELQIV